jgi:hypothetical protein
MGNCMQQLRADFPSLAQNCGDFRQSAQQIREEFRVLDRVQSTNSLVWEFFKLPKASGFHDPHQKEVSYGVRNIRVFDISTYWSNAAG